MTKFRQALKMYGRSKKNLFTVRNIREQLTMFDSDGVRLNGIYINYIPKFSNRSIKYLKNSPISIKTADVHPCNNTIDIYFGEAPSTIYKDNLPEMGSIIYAYDDGKIRVSRESKVKVVNIIPFSEASQSLISKWKRV